MTARIPDRLVGRWAVVSSQSPGEEQVGGEILDEWIIRPDSLRTSDGDVLTVGKVEEKEETHQALVLVSFSNNSLQYAFFTSRSQSEAVLVVMYLNGEEKMRCAITQEVFRD